MSRKNSYTQADYGDTLLPPILKKGDYIYGSFLKPEAINGYITNTNPAQKSSSLGQYSFAFSSISQAIAYAKATHTQWANRPIESRIEPIQRFQDELIKHHAHITKVISTDCGYPLHEASMEVNESIRFLQYLIEATPSITTDIEQKKHIQHKTSLGCLALLTPHVHSFYMSVFFSASALITGNVVIHKPSKYTPAIGQLIAEIWDRCSLKRGVYNMIQGPGTHISQQLIKNTQLDGIMFAGEYDNANIVHKRRPFHLPLILYCGGKGSAIVLSDADLEHTATELCTGLTLAGGQSPYGISHVFAEKTIADKLLSLLKEKISLLHISAPNKEKASQLGPMISEQIQQIYLTQGEHIKNEGHTTILEPLAISSLDGFFVQPSLFVINQDAQDILLDVELKGPTLLIYVLEDKTEIVQHTNKLAYRRSISIFSSSETMCSALLKQVDSGSFTINSAPSFPIVATPLHGKCSNGHREGIGVIRSLTQFTNIPRL